MRSIGLLLSSALVALGVACGAFGSGDSSTPNPTPNPNPNPTPNPNEDAGAPTPDASAPVDASIRCGPIACPGNEKCCLPLDGVSDAGCVARSAVCGTGFGELLCSNRTACGPTEVCCVTAERNAGQTGYDITRSFCVAESKCPDQNLQHVMCDLGDPQCTGGKACVPYLHDTNDLQQNLDVNPSDYATCQ